MTDHLTPLDASFLELEEGDESSHMHVGWAMLFDPRPCGDPPEVEDVRALLDSPSRCCPASGAGRRSRVRAG